MFQDCTCLSFPPSAVLGLLIILLEIVPFAIRRRKHFYLELTHSFSALQIPTALLYFQQLNLTFMALKRYLFETIACGTNYPREQVSGVFFIKSDLNRQWRIKYFKLSEVINSYE
jgi:hypothetical protein